VQNVQEASGSLGFCTFCTFCIGSEQLWIGLPPMDWAADCWWSCVTTQLFQAVEEFLRLVGIETVAQGLSAGIL
jgi:hypothetical protein